MIPPDERPFAYETTADGRVFISWNARRVTTLKGPRAARFIERVSALGPEAQQLEMARVTGNFKRGNER